MLVALFILFQNVPEFCGKELVSPNPTDKTIVGLAEGNALILAVSAAGEVLHRADGEWIKIHDLATQTNGLTFFEGRFVAFGTSDNAITKGLVGWISESLDGVNWTEVYQLPGVEPRAFAASGSRLVIVGGQGTCTYSDDGQNWATAASVFSGNLSYACYGNGFFLASSDDAAGYLRSTDGQTWEHFSSNIGPIAFANGQFASIASSPLRISSDGVNFSNTTVSFPIRDRPFILGVNSILFFGGKDSNHYGVDCRITSDFQSSISSLYTPSSNPYCAAETTAGILFGGEWGVISKYESQFFAIETGSDVQAVIISDRMINGDTYTHIELSTLKMTKDFKHWSFYLAPMMLDSVFAIDQTRYALVQSSSVVFFENGVFSNIYSLGNGVIFCLTSSPNKTLVAYQAGDGLGTFWVYELSNTGEFLPLANLGPDGGHYLIDFFQGKYYLSGTPPLQSEDGIDWVAIEELPNGNNQFRKTKDSLFSLAGQTLYRKDGDNHWEIVATDIA
ncbi:MAG: hypothetical protein KDC71_21465, partial [Acidobacteria bacterium]|nr:hypothetical protein [Acidobacteriota bacterium]